MSKVKHKIEFIKGYNGKLRPIKVAYAPNNIGGIESLIAYTTSMLSRKEKEVIEVIYHEQYGTAHNGIFSIQFKDSKLAPTARLSYSLQVYSDESMMYLNVSNPRYVKYLVTNILGFKA